MECNFKIDTMHLSYPYSGYYEDFIVELSDDQFRRLCETLYKLKESKELYSQQPMTDDDEWWLHKYLPDVHKIVRDELEKRAPEIWDEGIMPQLFNADIYAPDEAWEFINKLED